MYDQLINYVYNINEPELTKVKMDNHEKRETFLKPLNKSNVLRIY